MEIGRVSIAPWVVYVVRGDVCDHQDIESLRTELARGVERLITKKQLVVDLTGCTSINSRGVAVLIAIHERAEARQGKLILVCPQGIVRAQLITCGADNLIPIYDTRDEARGHGQQGGSGR